MGRKIIIYIANFFLIIVLFLIVSIVILSCTVLNKQYVKNILENNNYYERTYYSIENNFKNYTMQSGVEDNIVEGLISKEKVKIDINNVIDVVYDNKELNIDVQIVRQTLDNRINSILEENNRRPDAEEKESINSFEDSIVDTYSNGIIYARDIVENLSDKIAKMLLILNFVKVGLIILVLILIVVIVLVNKNITNTINILGITIFTLGILNITVKLLIGNKTHNILFLNLAFSQSLIELINSIIDIFFVVGIVFSFVGIVTIIASNTYKKDIQKK